MRSGGDRKRDEFRTSGPRESTSMRNARSAQAGINKYPTEAEIDRNNIPPRYLKASYRHGIDVLLTAQPCHDFSRDLAHAFYKLCRCRYARMAGIVAAAASW
jgi:hypothetical protein